MTNIEYFKHVTDIDVVLDPSKFEVTVTPQFSHFKDGKRIYVYTSTPVDYAGGQWNIIVIGDCDREVVMITEKNKVLSSNLEEIRKSYL